MLSILLGTSGCVCRKLGLRGRIAILLGLFVFGAGWSSYHLKYLSHEDILHITGSDDPDHRRLVRVEGIIQNVTHSRAGVHGDLHVSSLVDPTRGRRPVVGTLFTRLPASCSIVSGERIQCTGWVVPTRISGNEEDVHWAKHARYTGRRGYLLIPEPGNIMGLDVSSMKDQVTLLKGRVQQASLERLVDGISDDSVRSLLAGLVLGLRLESWKKTAAPFRRIGVAHLLAISGMHLGIIVAFAYGSMHLIRGSPGIQAAVSLAFLFIYIFMVEWRAPIQRASLMLCIYAILWMARRRCRTTGILVLTATGSIIHQPGEIFQAGFQLSYLVVFALASWAGIVQKRWSPRLTRTQHPGMKSISWCRSMFAVSVLAWLTATPIVLHHFEIISPLGPVLSVILFIPTVVIVILGFLRIILFAVIPPLDGGLCFLLEFVASSMITMSEWADSIPWSSFETGRPPVLITIMLLAGAAAWARYGVRHLYWSCRQLRQRVQFIQGP